MAGLNTRQLSGEAAVSASCSGSTLPSVQSQIVARSRAFDVSLARQNVAHGGDGRVVR
jgi:hypothetical protein